MATFGWRGTFWVLAALGAYHLFYILRRMSRQMRYRASDLRVFDMDDIGPHYATTLAHWRQRFRANLPRIRALGYDETFIRMWEYYLCYCEGGFLERVIGDVQMLLVKPANRRRPL